VRNIKLATRQLLGARKYSPSYRIVIEAPTRPGPVLGWRGPFLDQRAGSGPGRTVRSLSGNVTAQLRYGGIF